MSDLKHCFKCTSYVFICSFIFIHFKIIFRLPLVSSLIHVSLRCYLTSKYFGIPQFLLLISTLILLGSDNITYITVIRLNLLDLILLTYHMVCPGEVLCALEKMPICLLFCGGFSIYWLDKIHSVVLLYPYCLRLVLAVSERGMLKSPTILTCLVIFVSYILGTLLNI